MKAYGDPIIEHFATHSPECAGYSLVQLIETSNICAHFSDLTGDVYLDVYSRANRFRTRSRSRCAKTFFKPEDRDATDADADRPPSVTHRDPSVAGTGVPV